MVYSGQFMATNPDAEASSGFIRPEGLSPLSGALLLSMLDKYGGILTHSQEARKFLAASPTEESRKLFFVNSLTAPTNLTDNGINIPPLRRNFEDGVQGEPIKTSIVPTVIYDVGGETSARADGDSIEAMLKRCVDAGKIELMVYYAQGVPKEAIPEPFRYFLHFSTEIYVPPPTKQKIED